MNKLVDIHNTEHIKEAEHFLSLVEYEDSQTFLAYLFRIETKLNKLTADAAKHQQQKETNHEQQS